MNTKDYNSNTMVFRTTAKLFHKRSTVFVWVCIAIVVLACNITMAPSSTSNPVPTATSLQAPAPRPPLEIIDDKSVTMRFVDSGEFPMGSNTEDALKECQLLRNDCNKAESFFSTDFSNESPVHNVFVDAFYMDENEVTNALYMACVEAGTCNPPSDVSSWSHDSYFGNRNYDNYPVINVDWNMARTFCEWRGARLPTEAEWEKAARGPGGNIYPWGNTFDGTRANFCDKNCLWTDNANQRYDDGYADVALVGSYPSGVSVYGIFDLAGNVMEWTADWYGIDYYTVTPLRNPKGPSSGEFRVAKGGFFVTPGDLLRSSARLMSSPDVQDIGIGFRCVR